MKILKFIFSWSTLFLFCYSLSFLMVFCNLQFLVNPEFATICVSDVSHIPLLKDVAFDLLVISFIGLTFFGFSILSKLSKISGENPDKNKNENK